MELYTGNSKIVEFTEEKGLTRLYVNQIMQDYSQSIVAQGCGSLCGSCGSLENSGFSKNWDARRRRSKPRFDGFLLVGFVKNDYGIQQKKEAV